jgi:DNA-binding NtrC family response regulator
MDKTVNHETRRRVLVVDDERIIADTIALILDGHGFHSAAAYSGETALQLAPSLKPDILLSDVIMGEMNGIQLALAIRKIVPSCKTILISGQGASESLIQQAEVSGHHFELLIKPVHPTTLIGILDGISNPD